MNLLDLLLRLGLWLAAGPLSLLLVWLSVACFCFAFKFKDSK